MKNINRFVLAAIAVVSITMILSTGIAAAKQAAVIETASPLYKIRTANVVGVEKQYPRSNYTFYVLGRDRIRCTADCPNCTHVGCGVCTTSSDPYCSARVFPNMRYEINSFH